MHPRGCTLTLTGMINGNTFVTLGGMERGFKLIPWAKNYGPAGLPGSRYS